MGRRLDVNNRMFLRPSPNEELKLLQDEKQKLRKLRLQQVRQKEKILASKARKKFKEKEQKEMIILENELKKKWEEDIERKRNMLETEYYENVSHVGEGHQAALMCEDGGPKERSLEDEIKASERYKEALKKLKKNDAERVAILNEKTEAKNKAMEMERIRAARVAALQPPTPDIAQNLETIQKQRHKQTNIDHYSSTYYHIPQERVEKADPNLHQIDARRAAKEEEERLQNAKVEADRNFSEQMEKARLRHKHARSKLLLEKDHNKLLEELEHFERIDRQRRQEVVAKIPKHVFEPPHRRIEATEERQREIEHAFEDMYMSHTNYMGDITVAQESLPFSPTVTDEESSIDREERDKIEVQARDEDDIESENASEIQPTTGEGRRKFVEEAEKSRTDSKPSSKDPLKRLLKKIDIQRDRWKSEMKTKDIEQRRNIPEAIIPDYDSEISEGTLTMTTENTRSVNAESDVANGKRTTLLHPREEAERARAASQYIQIPDAKRKIEIEEHKERLQQQKLKLQLQQQQIMQEHLQLQFDALNNDMIMKEGEDESKEGSTHEDHPPTEVKEDANFRDLSSGVLSDDGKTVEAMESVVETVMSESSEDEVNSFHTDDSRVNTNVQRHSVLYSIPESGSEKDFNMLPTVPSSTIPTTSGLPKMTSVERTRISPRQPSTSVQHITTSLPSPLHSAAQLDVSVGDSENKQPHLYISPPHLDITAPTHSEVPTSQLRNSVTEKTKSIQTGFTKQPVTAAVHYDDHQPILFPKRKSPESMQPGVNHGRVIISNSTSPFVNIPSTISSTPFLPEGTETFNFPGNRDTTSYLNFYQKQLLEQQNRIREQQKAIQERQQQRLEQLKQFQERLRGQRVGYGQGTSIQRETRKSFQSDGQWQSLIPNNRYQPYDETSTSSNDSQSGAVSVDHVSTNSHSENTISPEQPQLKSLIPTSEISEDLVNDTSSSLSRYRSEVISIKDHNDTSVLPKTSDLGLWSDSTPHLSSSDATKSSSTALDESKTEKKFDGSSRAKVLQDLGLSSSSLSNDNNGSASETNNFNRSSKGSSLKSGSSIDSGPLSTSSLPKSGDKNISSSSSASDSNNNLLLQRMEHSFQHFQEMIDEAKALNEKYLDETKDSRNVGVGKRSFMKDDDVNDSEVENIPKNEEFRPTRPSNDTSPSHSLLVENKGIMDSISEPIASDIGDGSPKNITSDQGTSNDNQYISVDTPRDNEDNFEFIGIKDFAYCEGGERLFISSMISNQENLNFQSPENEIFADQASPSLRALSVIPEESHVSEDDLSEGILEDEDQNNDMPVYKEHQVPLSHVEQANIDLEGIIHDEDQEYGDFVASVSQQPFNPLDHFTQQTHTSLSYFPNRSPEQDLFKQRTASHCSEPHEDQQHGPENESFKNIVPGSIMTSVEASVKFGLHVDLPTAEKRTYNDTSSDRSMNDVVFSGLSSLSLSRTDESSSSSPSLQEAFRKSRPQFFKHSQERVMRLKEARHKKLPRQKEDCGYNQQDKIPVTVNQKTANISPKSSERDSEKVVEAIKQSSDGRHKIGKEEMKSRTKRLYENLPDIRQKTVEKQRRETYAANRAKAQEFQKQTRERLRKLNAKKTGKAA